jgi:hypothetical protein
MKYFEHTRNEWENQKKNGAKIESTVLVMMGSSAGIKEYETHNNVYFTFSHNGSYAPLCGCVVSTSTRHLNTRRAESLIGAAISKAGFIRLLDGISRSFTNRFLLRHYSWP